MRRSAIILMVSCAALAAPASDISTVSGEFTYIGSSSLSPDECRQKALEGARLKALAGKYGTILTHTTDQTDVVDSSGEHTAFASYTSTDVRGEWLGDVDAPEFSDIRFDSAGNMVVTCRVRGKARSISNNAPEVDVRVMCGGTNAASEGTRFEAGQKIYLRFRSPSDGWLAVYLLDADGASNCLLPYASDSDGQARVRAGVEYVLFCDSPLYSYPEIAVNADEYILYTDRRRERNTLYVVFSPNQFTKAVDMDARLTDVGNGSPRWLSGRDFEKWQLDMRRRDDRMSVTKVPLTIVNSAAPD